MANLYNKAGLVNIPIGYSDGFLYNIKPVDDTLAFRFNRDSSATRVNKQGLIEQVGYFGPELVQNGNFDTDSDWNLPSGSSISGGSLNIDGTQTSGININQTIASLDLTKIYKVTFTVSNYIAGNVKVKISNDAQGTDKTANGTYTEYLSGMANKTLSIRANADFIGSIDNVSVVEVLGNKPRIDYTDSLTSPSFLLEPQRTNLVTYSEDFSQWTLQSGTTVTSNTTETLSPSGEYNASKIAGNGTNGLLKASVGTGGGTNTKSIYIKGTQSGQVVYIKDPNETVNNKPLILTTDWQRYTLTESQTSSFGIWINAIPSSGIYMWGAQTEEGSYATSYIPTSGSTATRVAETCNGAGNASTFNDSEGVLYAEISALADDATNRKIAIGTSSNRIIFGYKNSSNQIRVEVISSGSVVFDNSQTIDDVTIFSKFAIKYKQNDFALWMNGEEIAIDTSGNTPIGLSELAFDDGSGGNNFYGKTKALAVFKEALTDAELQQLTS